MANYAQIVFEVIDYSLIVPNEGYLGVDDTIASIALITSEPATVRSVGFFKIGTSNESTSFNIANALIADYTNNGLLANNNFSIVANGAFITITANEYGHAFIDASIASEDWLSLTSITDEDAPPPVLSIDSIALSEAASNPNINIRRTLTLSNAVYPVTINTPIIKVCANAGEVWFDGLRDSFGTISITDDTLTSDTIDFQTVESWTLTDQATNVSLMYLNGYANASINPTQNNEGEISLIEYSIDDINWQTGNIFYGLLIDDYTAYIRDQWGMDYSIPFAITVIPSPEKPEPFFDISSNQTFDFKELNTYDQDTDFANQFNSLYDQQDFKNKYKAAYCQPFNQSDSRKVQIRTTYDNVSVTVIDSDGEDVVVYTPTRQKQYVALKDMRDGILKDAGNNQTHLYFVAGNTYDYETEVDTGDYSLQGRLESWMYDIESIQFVKIVGSASMDGQYEVSGRDYDSDLKVSVLVLNLPFNDVQATPTAQVKFVYNAEDFDVYESTIPMAALNGHYHLEIEATDTDPRYLDKTWVSEPIYVLPKHEDHALIEWSDTKVIDDLDYSTGITHGVRVAAVFTTFAPNGEKENMEDDQGRIIPLKAIKKKTLSFETGHIPPYLVDKLTTAISMHDSVVINSLPIQTADFGESEPVDKSSMMKLNINCQYNETVTYFDDNSVMTPSSGNNVLGVSDQGVLGV